MNLKKLNPKSLLKILFPALVVVLLSISTQSCVHAKKATDVEFWLIDENDLLLYRTLKNNDTEETLPIKENLDMRKFIVIDRREFLRLFIADIEER